MKNYLLIPILLLLAAMNSCKKVDDANRYNQSLPTVSGGGSSYITGDTLSLGGRLFYETGTLKIHIGNSDGKIIAHSQTTTEYYGNNTLFDQIKVVLTPEMGVGNNIPITITANGHTIDAAPINISKFTPVTGATDTTLFVDKLLTWKPADVSRYQYNDTVNQYILTLPSIVRASVNPSGGISFFNPVGFFNVENARVSPIVQAGDSFTENGQQFAVRYIVGATNTADPNSYYFSAEVLEANHDIKVSLIYRLFKFDMASRTVTTLNRSEVVNFPNGDPIDPRPFQGDATSVKAVACNLKVGANGDLFFLNSYPLANDHYSVDDWHTLITSQSLPRGYSHYNLCSYKIGKILSLFSDHDIVDDAGLLAPGVNSAAFDDYLLSPDGNMIMVYNARSATADKYLMYDLAKKAPFYAIGDKAFRLKSFDNDPATKFPFSTSTIILSTSGAFAVPMPGLISNFSLNGAILPNGDLAFQYGTSMGSFNFLANNGYCYAGEEIGFGGNGSAQTTDVGKAKHVNFSNKLIFGTDRSLNFYFFKPDYSSNPYSVTFYKMYGKK